MSARLAGGAIRRLLIANRGEIAVRIITACREAGIAPVAVYSEADRNALHVQVAGEAVCVGPAPPADSYLNQDAIVAAAKASGAQAIHPGYGFLAENADFADRCQVEGLIFVGPSAEAIRLMGDKAAAKRLAREEGVPVVPGYDGEEQSDTRFASEARRIGFPLMIKAVAGGGGKGMHAVRRPRELRRMLAQARREALGAFGDGRLLLERLIERARHIEIQVVGDVHGALVAVGERDCSIQRRHQKIIEESPSPAVDDALRRRLAEYALAIANRARYSNAGTVEFLRDQDGEVYFLEMNTRLQVEHAVTEAVYGIDLVRLQLELAAGHPLPLRQEALVPRGHAIECRIYAEDPHSGFLPSTGRVLAFQTPEGPGLRNDIGTYAGDTITLWYDPLLAKLTVHAANRAAALQRMSVALSSYSILGLRTNVAFLRSVVSHADFAGGRFDIDFLDREPRLAAGVPVPPPEALFAATAAEILRAGQTGERASLWHDLGPWRLGGQGLSVSWESEGQEFEVHASRLAGGGWRLQSGETEFSGDVEPVGDHSLLLRGPNGAARFDVAGLGREVWVGRLGESWLLTRPAPPGPRDRRTAREGSSARSLNAPMPGRVARVEVAEGERVAPHQVLLILEAMKMEHAIESPGAGIVRRLYCRAGDLVSSGARLVDLDESG